MLLFKSVQYALLRLDHFFQKNNMSIIFIIVIIIWYNNYTDTKMSLKGQVYRPIQHIHAETYTKLNIVLILVRNYIVALKE